MFCPHIFLVIWLLISSFYIFEMSMFILLTCVLTECIIYIKFIIYDFYIQDINDLPDGM